MDPSDIAMPEFPANMLNATNIGGIIITVICVIAILKIPRMIRNARRRMSSLILASVLLGSTSGMTMHNIVGNVKAPRCPDGTTLVATVGKNLFSGDYMCIRNDVLITPQH